MKIILSRKGFDSANGGRPSPIMPDGTLLSMPIPSETDALTYSDLGFKGETYASILNRLYPGEDWSGKHCHNDPDIRKNRVCDSQIWEPAFGQVNSAQGTLCNAGVSKGDLFLFFVKIILREGIFLLVMTHQQNKDTDDVGSDHILITVLTVFVF